MTTLDRHSKVARLLDWLVPPHYPVRILILAVQTSETGPSRPVASSADTSWSRSARCALA
jgi:hypothetical protein